MMDAAPSPLLVVGSCVLGILIAAALINSRKRKTVPNLPDDL